MSAAESRVLDALVEIANIGAGHAAGALSGLLGDRPVRIEVPRAQRLAVADLARLWGDQLEVVTSIVYVQVEGDLPGAMLLWLPPDFQETVGELLAPDLVEAARQAPESLVGEFGNIVLTSYLNAVADLAARRLVPTVPVVAHDMVGAILQSALAVHPDAPDEVILLETVFVIDDRPLAGYILHLPERSPFARLLAEMGVGE